MKVADIKKLGNEYVDFMKIDSLPAYKIQPKTVSLEKVDKNGFDSVAQSSYNCASQEHMLIYATNIDVLPYIFFHEFTHMLDSEMYVNNDKSRYAGLSGYTEYHASQVELMKLLGADSINLLPAFSMAQQVETIAGIKSVQEYLDNKKQTAIDLFSRSEFPKDIEQLKGGLGVLFNYWGQRSICRMFSNDYIEKEDNSAFLKLIPLTIFHPFNVIMTGWMGTPQIEASIKGYLSIVFDAVQKYRLK